MIELIAILAGFNNRVTEIFKDWLRDGVSDERVNDEMRKRLTLIFSVVFGWLTMIVLVYGLNVSFTGYDLGAIGRNDAALVFFGGGLSSAGAGFFQVILDLMKSLNKPSA